jgi:hypothetical protein
MKHSASKNKNEDVDAEFDNSEESPRFSNSVNNRKISLLCAPISKE